MLARVLDSTHSVRPSSRRPLMLTIRDLKMSYGGRVLFEGASLQVNYGDRVALVGPNGAGKSTLFSIILREETPDEGTVERDAWTMVATCRRRGRPWARRRSSTSPRAAPAR